MLWAHTVTYQTLSSSHFIGHITRKFPIETNNLMLSFMIIKYKNCMRKMFCQVGTTLRYLLVICRDFALNCRFPFLKYNLTRLVKGIFIHLS